MKRLWILVIFALAQNFYIFAQEFKGSNSWANRSVFRENFTDKDVESLGLDQATGFIGTDFTRARNMPKGIFKGRPIAGVILKGAVIGELGILEAKQAERIDFNGARILEQYFLNLDGKSMRKWVEIFKVAKDPKKSKVFLGPYEYTVWEVTQILNLKLLEKKEDASWWNLNFLPHLFSWISPKREEKHEGSMLYPRVSAS